MNLTPEELMRVLHSPHPETHRGRVVLGENIFISQGARIDITGSVEIGDYCMIGEYTRIFSHDHFHDGREPLLLLQQRKGVKWQDKVIGRDVWLHGCIVLYQVTNIPDGVVVAAGAVLTKNPEVPYGIFAGNPAVLVGER